MAKKRGIRLRISGQRLAALLEICEEMLEEFIPKNEHQCLLREYLLELKQQVRDMLQRNQENYTLMLAGTAALAFSQLWRMLDIRTDKYANLIVGNLLEKLGTLAT